MMKWLEDGWMRVKGEGMYCTWVRRIVKDCWLFWSRRRDSCVWDGGGELSDRVSSDGARGCGKYKPRGGFIQVHQRSTSSVPARLVTPRLSAWPLAC